MNATWKSNLLARTSRASWSPGHLGIALLAVASTAISQTSAPVGISKSAEYDCNGLEGVALTSCRQLNASAARGALVQSNGSAAYDCAGMTGASLMTCRDLNGEPVVSAPGTSAGGNIAGYATGVPTAILPGTSTSVPSISGDQVSPSPAGEAVTPIQQQTTSGTNPIAPSASGSLATTNGTNSITPSGTGETALSSRSNPISLSGAGLPAAPSEPVPTEMSPATGTVTTEPRIVPGNGQVSPPNDRMMPVSPVAPSAAVVGTPGPAASGPGRTGK